MRSLILVFVLFFSSACLVSAETPRDQRRLEEEARDDLRYTEPEPSVVSEPALEAGPSIDLSFFQRLFEKKYLLRRDAIQPILILLNKEDLISQDEEAQIKFLKEENILPPRLAKNFSPGEPLRKGLTAYMFCQALGLKGGIGARIFGMSQRYAMSELAFRGIMPEGSIDKVIRGPEFISFFTRAVEYLAQKNEARKARIQK